jgi:hypothetical protein
VDQALHRSDGLVQFCRQGKYERCPKSWATSRPIPSDAGKSLLRVYVFADANCSSRVLSRGQSVKHAVYDDMIRQRLMRLQFMRVKVESPSETVELEI